MNTNITSDLNNLTSLIKNERHRTRLILCRETTTSRTHDNASKIPETKTPVHQTGNYPTHHDDHVGLQVTYMVYQDIIDAYSHPKRSAGKKLMKKVMDTIRNGLPTGLEELAQLGRTLWHKRTQVLAFFDHGGASNGPVEAVNGRLEHLRGIALGFRNFDHYVLRCLIHSGQLTKRINAL